MGDGGIIAEVRETYRRLKNVEKLRKLDWKLCRRISLKIP